MGFDDWPRKRRDPPADLLTGPPPEPGSLLMEVDNALVPDLDGDVPLSAMVGFHVLGPDGRPTGEYAFNPSYGLIRDDFTRLESPDHWLGWLPDTPGTAVRRRIEKIVTGQVPGANVEWIRVTDDPAFLTGGRQSPDDPNKVVVTRAALAVPFALAVTSPDGDREILSGVLSWVVTGLDTPDAGRDQVWFDLGMTIEDGGELLQQRIYEPDFHASRA